MPDDHKLSPCPQTPNCVSSLADDEIHAVDPIPFSGPWESAMARLERVLSEMPGARIVSLEGPYLRATFRSPVLRFVDDLELLADPEASLVHVRSASRVGSWDFGANRRRVERLASLFLAPE